MARQKANLLQGTLDLIVLRLLQHGSNNGWELTQRIQAMSRDVLDVNAGSLYPALHRLEARGWVKSEIRPSENNRRAKYYTLTATGRKQLVTERESWERFAGALSAILRGS